MDVNVHPDMALPRPWILIIGREMVDGQRWPKNINGTSNLLQTTINFINQITYFHIFSHIFTKVSHTFHQESFAFQLPIPHLVSSSHATIMVAERFTPSTQWTKTLELGSSKAAWQRGRISKILQTTQVSIEFTEIQLAQLVSSSLCKPWENSLGFLQNK